MNLHVGPLFWFETIRQSRTASGHWSRLCYCAIFLFILYVIFGSQEITIGKMPKVAEACATGYVTLQYLAVLLLTPVFVVSSIIDDRKKRVYEVLLTTHLEADEILVGKLLSRLVHVLVVLASGIPVLALLQVLGGVNMVFVLCHTCLALMLLVTVGCFALRSALWASSTLTGILFTWLLLLPGLGFAFVPAYFFGYLFEDVLPLSPIVLGLSCSLLFNAWLSIRMMRDAIRAMENRKPTLLELEKMSHPRPLRAAEPVNDDAGRERAAKLASREVRLRREHFSFYIAEVGSNPLTWLEANFPPLEWGFWMPMAYLIIPAMMALFSWTNLFFFFLIKLLAVYYLYMVSVHIAAGLAEDRFQSRLESLLTLPYERPLYLFERLRGACWRYRHLFFNIVLAFGVLLFVHPAHHWLVLFLVITQIAFWVTVGSWLGLLPFSTFVVKLLIGGAILLSAMMGFYCCDVMGVPLMALSSLMQLVIGLFCPWSTWSMIQSYNDHPSNQAAPVDIRVWTLAFMCLNLIGACFFFWRSVARSNRAMG